MTIFDIKFIIYFSFNTIYRIYLTPLKTARKNGEVETMKDKTLLGLNLSAFLMMIGVGMIVALLPQRIIELDGNFSIF